MARFLFEVLSPGRRCVGFNADGTKQFVTFTPEYVREQHRKGLDLLAKGINIPACLNHQSTARPTQLSRDEFLAKKAASTVGWVEAYKLDGDRLKAEVEVPEDSDQATARRVRFCSPRINRFTDAEGKEWGDIIEHVALTPRPVQYPQAAAIQLSLCGPIELSLDPEKGDDMAEEKKEPEKKAETEETPEKEGDYDIPELIKCLEECEMVIPKEAKTIKEIIIALKAMHGGEEPADAGGTDDELPENVGESSERPIAMSLEQRKKRAAALEAKAVASARANLKQRAKSLLSDGKVTRPISLSLEQEAEKAPINFDDKGDVRKNAVIVKLECYEALPKNATFPVAPGAGAVDMSLYNERERPADLDGQKKDDEILAEWDKT